MVNVYEDVVNKWSNANTVIMGDFNAGGRSDYIRYLYTEHTKSQQSSVFKHTMQCINNKESGFNFHVTIVGSDTDETNLRLREAIVIQQQKPKLNSKSEMDELKEFLFL